MALEFFRHSFDDLDLMCATLAAWDVEFNPLSRADAAQAAGSYVQCIGGNVCYSYAAFAPPILMGGAPPERMITFNIMEPTERRYWLRGIDLDAGMAWVFPVGSELRSVSPPEFKVHTLSASEEHIDLIAMSLEIVPPRLSKRPEVFAIPEATLARMRNCLNILHRGPDALSAVAMEDVLGAFVAAWLAPISRGTKKRPSMRARDIAVRKCLELSDAEGFNRLPMASLLEEITVSERTLQYAFRDRFGLSPAEFFKRRRLAEVRSALRRGDPDVDTIANIAALSGFWHLGQFATDYRRVFGERPSETLNRRK